MSEESARRNGSVAYMYSRWVGGWVGRWVGGWVGENLMDEGTHFRSFFCYTNGHHISAAIDAQPTGQTQRPPSTLCSRAWFG